jgi:prevent-host-death family protein
MTVAVNSTEVQADFGRYEAAAQSDPVLVMKEGRPHVVILSAAEYARLRRLDREVLAVTELTEDDIAAIERARIPDEHRYHSDQLP